MAMEAGEIERLIKEGIPDADVTIEGDQALGESVIRNAAYTI